MSTADNSVKKDLARFVLEQLKAQQIDKKRAAGFLNLLSASTSAPEEIAIVGIGCRFPEADSPAAFWDNLRAGRNSIRAFPADRRARLAALDGYRTELFHGGFLDGVDLFDNEYFQIPPRAARHMDPYQRLMMETMVETIEDAGLHRSALYGKQIGIYVGNDHTHRLFNSYVDFIDEVDFQSVTGSWTAVLASRLSYLFNLRGPAVVVDTACSSGLVALDAAIKALRDGDCEAALVGAANLFFAPGKGLVGDIENDTFEVRAFDGDAQGTAWGEGVAALMIKPLQAALRDGDPIHAVIKGLATNNDGASNGLTAPNAKAQQEVLLKAWERAGVRGDALSYLEAHGTGTQLGDPIEIKGVIGAFERHSRRRQFCAIGSVKTNIGHTVGVAGLASLIKVVLGMKHQTIPPSLHFDRPNRHIDFCNSPVYVADRALPWPQGDAPRVAGVSSFSICGTNCHVVVQEAPLRASAETPARDWPFVLSARSAPLLRATVRRLSAWAERGEGVLNDSIADICYTACAGREAHGLRMATVVGSRQGLRERLRALDLALSAPDADADTVAVDGWLRGEAQEQTERSGREQRDDALARWQSGDDAALRPLLALYVDGAHIAWDAVFAQAPRRRVHLPTQPFLRNAFWDKAAIDPGSGTLDSAAGMAGHPTRSPEEQGEQGRDYWLARIAAEPSRIRDLPCADDGSAEAMAHRVAAYAWSEVLGYPQLSLDDDYYALGGDSIGATRIVQMLNATFDTGLVPGDLLGMPGLGNFVRHLLTEHAFAERLAPRDGRSGFAAAETDASTFMRAPEVSDEAQAWPLSRAQWRMYLLERMSAGSTAYHVNALVRLGDEERLDPERVEALLRRIVDRHEILRTGFEERDGEPIQVVHTQAPFVLERVRLAGAPDDAARHDALQSAMDAFVRPFDLARPPLLRVALFEMPDAPAHMAIDMHHIVTDGSSMGVLMREFSALAAGEPLPPLPLQYRDFAAADRGADRDARMQAHARYWLERFSGPLPELTLQTDLPRASIQDYRGAKIHATVDPALSASLRELARRQGTTLFVLLLAAFKATLHRMGGGEDIVVGSPVAGRERLELNALIGMFVNTLALRDRIDPAQPFATFLAQVRATVFEALRHQAYSYESLVETLGLGRAGGRNALFDVCFSLQNEDIGLGEGGPQLVPLRGGSAKFDMTVMARDTADGIVVDWEYATALYTGSSARRFIDAYLRVLACIAADPVCPVGALDPLSDVERALLLHGYNDTATDYPRDAGIPALFAVQAAARPQAVAVQMDDACLSYAELDAQSSRLAHALIAHGVRRGDRVALLYRRSIPMIVAIFAVLKAGAAYVPLDVENPASRSAGILADSGAEVLLAGDGMAVPEAWPVRCLRPEGLDLQVYPLQPPPVPVNGDDIACIMFTSGSTGAPKGAAIRHRGIVRVVVRTNYLHLGSDDVCLLVSNYAFDGSFPDIYGALLNGARLLLLGRPDVMDMDLLADTMIRHRATSTFMTTALFNALVDLRPEALDSMRSLMFGGESASVRHAARAVERVGPGRIIHCYGPTETTVFATALVLDHVGADAHALPIGTPIANTRVYLLDAAMRPVPHGVEGEIYIGGDGVAAGYLQREALTAERFVPNPHVAGDVLYRTGDLAKRLDDGNVQFIGRRDHQVKIRGFRIELTEIEAAIMALPGIKETLVVAHEEASGQKLLCAYVVPVAPEQEIATRIATALSATLPYYMVPAATVVLEAFPLNANGKIDRRALPPPRVEEREMVAPRTAIERRIAEVWAGFLDIGRIGVHDNFFALGGDSIKAIQIVARLQAEGLPLDVQQIMQFQTIAELGAWLESDGADRTGPARTAAPAAAASAPVAAVSHEELDEIFSDLDIV